MPHREPVVMTFAIAAPQQLAPGGFDRARFRDYLQEAEGLGFAGTWVSEQVVGTAPLLAPLEVLALAAGCTETLRLGTAAIVSTVQSPLHLAKSIATLDHLSGGRVEVGLAGGGSYRPFGAYGVPAQRWAGRFAEGVELMVAAWAPGPVTFDGKHFQAHELPVEPKPVQRPHPPLWIGGSAPAALRRAVRLADGFFGAGSTTTAAFAKQAAALPPQEGFRIAKRVYIAVDDDAARARDAISARLDQLYGWYGLRDLLPVAVAGTPDECVAGVRAVVAAGAEMVLLDPVDDDPAVLRRLAAVAEEAAG